MKLYNLHFKWTHRKWGPSACMLKQKASNLPLALKRGTAEFLKTLDTKERFDVNKWGVIVTITYLGKVEIEGKVAP
jgi:hypothetical protein